MFKIHMSFSSNHFECNVVNYLISTESKRVLRAGNQSVFLSFSDAVSWPLQNFGPFTVFVPINKGFRGLSVRILS